MIEGWLNDDYIVLFAEPQMASASARYAIDTQLPEMTVVGLRGWDDLLVRNAQGNVFSVPTLPLLRSHLVPFEVELSRVVLKRDPRFEGYVKWYVKPIVFGGSPEDPSNTIWVSHEQHGELVRWWNQKYQEIASGP
jgi:hypothetical protein